MEFHSIILIIFAVIFLIIILKLKVANHDQRFASFVLGQYKELVGPGMVVKWSGSEIVWQRISIGQRGELMSGHLAQFDGGTVPVTIEGAAEIGDIVRITGFKENDVEITKDTNQAKYYVCEKCGHRNPVGRAVPGA